MLLALVLPVLGKQDTVITSPVAPEVADNKTQLVLLVADHKPVDVTVMLRSVVSLYVYP